MNLLAHANVRDYRPRCGKLIPGTNTFETIAPLWGPPQVQVYEDERVGWIMESVNTLMARPDVHVCAIAPVALTATPEIGRHSGEPTGVWQPHYAITVIYQARQQPDRAA